MAEKKSALGRGLGALIDMKPTVQTGGSSLIDEIELSHIEANPTQPRTIFDEEALQELATSIKELGVVQPITVREVSAGKYMIIAGERRYRAAKRVGLNTIPAYIRTAKDEQVMEWALIENIQREDLDAIEIALAYQRLMDEYHLTQERMSERVGKKRATVANYLRLLKLPAEIQLGIKEKKIDMGHARAILGSPSPEQQLSVYKKILQNGLSVRKVEELVSQIKPEKKDKKVDITYNQQEQLLNEVLRMPVKISAKKLTISFKDEEELNRLVDKLI